MNPECMLAHGRIAMRAALQRLDLRILNFRILQFERSRPTPHLGYAVRLAALAAILCLLAVCTRAQLPSAYQRQFDLAGGYAFMRGYADGTGNGFNLNGGSASLTYYFGSRLAVVGDFGAYHFSNVGPQLSSNIYTYVAGPRLRLSHGEGHFAPFVQVLAGGGRITASTTGVSAGENAFVLAAGGGVDLTGRGHFTFRLLEVEYFMNRFAHPDGSSAMQNNVRVGAGVVFHFGRR